MFTAARLRLTGWFALTLALVLIGTGLAIYFTVRSRLNDEVTDSIQLAAESLREAPAGAIDGGFFPSRFDDGGAPAGGGGRRGGNGPQFSFISTDVFYLTSDGSAVLANPRQVSADQLSLAALSADADSGNAWADLTVSGSEIRFATYKLTSLTREGKPIYLHVGRSLESRNRDLRSLTETMAIAAALSLMLAIAGGYVLAGRSLSPIRRSVESQRRFVSDASHEVRTPVAVIKANAETLARNSSETVEENLDAVEAIASQADHLTHLVQDLLTLARADEGRLELASEPLDLGQLAEGVVREMGIIAEVREIGLASDTVAVQVTGDRARLRQLVAILVDNAVKYTPSGGNVSVSVKRVGRTAELSVIDTGPGIPPADQGHIFDRFYRSDSGRTRSGGTGLGLSIARWIADTHGGRIGVASEAGKGSTFTVRLPVL